MLEFTIIHQLTHSRNPAQVLTFSTICTLYGQVSGLTRLAITPAITVVKNLSVFCIIYSFH